MKINRFLGLVITFILASSLPLWAESFVYPAEGQSPEQQRQDEFECHEWAVAESGFDPTQPAQASTPPPSQEAPRGGLVQGGARGAALGAVGGAIAGNAGQGAAIGAATGGLIGGMRRQDQRQQQQQAENNWNAEQRAIKAEGREAYDRARAACLTGRGYTVK